MQWSPSFAFAHDLLFLMPVKGKFTESYLMKGDLKEILKKYSLSIELGCAGTSTALQCVVIATSACCVRISQKFYVLVFSLNKKVICLDQVECYERRKKRKHHHDGPVVSFCSV